ncbi:MAG: hypothetical protein ACJ77U_02740, partial [Chloroflexota bacterium]
MIRRLLLLCCVALACVAPVPRPSAPQTPRPPEAVASNDARATSLLPSNVETVTLAQTMEAVSPRWGPTPDGPILLDEFGESQVVVGAGTHLIVTSDPQPGPDGTWVAAWVVASDSSWPSDYVAWFPASQRGRATIRSMPREGCPGVATIATIAPLLPDDRRRCVGSGDIAFEAKTWFPGATPGYDVDSVWFGSGSDLRGSVALFDAGLDPFG